MAPPVYIYDDGDLFDDYFGPDPSTTFSAGFTPGGTFPPGFGVSPAAAADCFEVREDEFGNLVPFPTGNCEFKEEKEAKKLAAGVIAAIVLGIMLCCVLPCVAGAVVLCCIASRKQTSTQKPGGPPETAEAAPAGADGGPHKDGANGDVAPAQLVRHLLPARCSCITSRRRNMHAHSLQATVFKWPTSMLAMR